MKVKFIVNPISGTGKQNGIEDIIKDNLKTPFKIVYTKKSGDATLLCQEAIKEPIDVVIAVGGDGTVNECAKALINTNTALGVIPCGSGNGFAYHIGMKRKMIDAVKQLNSCIMVNVDSCSANNIPFVNVSGIGFDAHIAQLFSTNKKRGFFTYAKLVLKELSYKAKDYTLDYNNETKNVKAFLIAFANTSQYGNDAMISPRADIKDGLIDFVIVREFPKWKILFFLYSFLKGRVHLSKYTEIIKAKKIKIHSESGLIHLDGESITCETPIHIEVNEGSLKTFTPK